MRCCPTFTQTQTSRSFPSCISPARGWRTRTGASLQSWSMEPQGKKTMANDKKSGMASDIRNAIKEGTKDWTRVRKSEERNPSSRSYRAQRLYRERGVQFKEAAAEIMEAAYME